MGKTRVEVCLISARGLRRSSLLWKVQWFAVGWIDPNNKYCTSIDVSGNANPVWRTKFDELVDDSKSQDMALHIEVHSREPIFLRERLEGTATVVLREFLAKNSMNEQLGSYQLRKRNSTKPQGFVDVSVRISRETEEPTSSIGNDGGLEHKQDIILSSGFDQRQLPFTSIHQPVTNSPSSQQVRYPQQRGPRNAPPPTPSNVGYNPNFLSRTENPVNMPRGQKLSPGFGLGLGAGALAAGAIIFGDNFISGFDVPAGPQEAATSISNDPLF